MMIEMKQFVSNRAAIVTDTAEIIKWSGTLEKHCRGYRRKKRQVQITDTCVIYWKEKGEKKTISYTWHKGETSGENNTSRVDCDNERRNITIHSSKRKYEFTARTEEDYGNIKAALGFGISDMIISEPQNVKHHFAVQEDRKTKQLSTLGADKSVETNDDVIAELKKRGNEKVPTGLDITNRCEKNGTLNTSFLFNRSEYVTLSKEEFEKVKEENFDTFSIRSDFLYGDYEEQGSDVNPRVMKENGQMTDQDIQQLGNDEIEKLDEENINRNLVESMNLKGGINDTSRQNKDVEVLVDEIDASLHLQSLDQNSRDLSAPIGDQMSEVSTSCTTKLNIAACSDRTEFERYVSTDNHAQLKAIRSLKGNSLDQNSHICPADLEKQISEPMISSKAKPNILARPSITQNYRDVNCDSLSQRNTAQPLTKNPPEPDSNNRSPAVGKQISEPPKRSDKFKSTHPPSSTQDEREEDCERNTLERTVHTLKTNPPDKDSKIRSAVFENQISEPPIFSTAKTNLSAHEGLAQDDSDACYDSHPQLTTIRFLKENPPKHNSKIRPAVDGNLISEPPISFTAKMSAPSDRTKVKRDGSSDTNAHRRTLHPMKEIAPNTDSKNRSTTVGNHISEPTTYSTKFSADPGKPQNRSWGTSDINAQGKTAHSLKENVSDHDSKICSAAVGIRQSRPPEPDSKIHSGTENNTLEPPIPEQTKRHFSKSRDTEKGERNEGSPRHATQTTPSVFKENPPGQDSKFHSAAVEIGRSGPPDYNSNIQSETVGNITTEPQKLVQANIDIPAITGRIHEERNNRIQENPLYPNVKSRSASVENRPSEPTGQNSKISSGVVSGGICLGNVGNSISASPIPEPAERYFSTRQGREREKRNAGSSSHSQSKTSLTLKETPPDSNAKNSSAPEEKQQSGARGYYSNTSSGTLGSKISEPQIPEPGENHISTSWDNGKEKKNEGSHCNATQTTPSTFKENPPDQDSKTRSAAVEIGRSELPDYNSIGRSWNLGNHISDPPVPVLAERYVSARADRTQGVTNLASYRHASSFKDSPLVQNTSLRSETVGNQISEIGTTYSPSSARRNGTYRFGQGRQEVSDPGHQQNQRRRNVAAQHDANGRFLTGNTNRRVLVPLQPRPNREDIEVSDPGHQQNQRRRNVAAQHDANCRFLTGNAIRQAARVHEPRQNLEAAGRAVRVLQPRPNMLAAGRAVRVFAARPNMVNAGRAARVLEPRTNRMDAGRAVRVLEPRTNRMDAESHTT